MLAMANYYYLNATHHGYMTMIRATRTNAELLRIHSRYSALLSTEAIAVLVRNDMIAEAKKEMRLQDRVRRARAVIVRELYRRNEA